MPTEVLYHVDILITCAAPPDVEVPEPFRGPKFNMHLARGARLIGPRLAFTVLFEVNAADEEEAKAKAAAAIKEVLDSIDRQQPERQGHSRRARSARGSHRRRRPGGPAGRRHPGADDRVMVRPKTVRRTWRVLSIAVPFGVRWGLRRRRRRQMARLP